MSGYIVSFGYSCCNEFISRNFYHWCSGILTFMQFAVFLQGKHFIRTQLLFTYYSGEFVSFCLFVCFLFVYFFCFCFCFLIFVLFLFVVVVVVVFVLFLFFFSSPTFERLFFWQLIDSLSFGLKCKFIKLSGGLKNVLGS